MIIIIINLCFFSTGICLKICNWFNCLELYIYLLPTDKYLCHSFKLSLTLYDNTWECHNEQCLTNRNTSIGKSIWPGKQIHQTIAGCQLATKQFLSFAVAQRIHAADIGNWNDRPINYTTSQPFKFFVLKRWITRVKDILHQFVIHLTFIIIITHAFLMQVLQNEHKWIPRSIGAVKLSNGKLLN